jgi:hypothetical protein
VRFVVVGAHALAVQGRPRATGDLDIFVEPTKENARRLGRALAAFGFPALSAEAAAFAEPDRMVTLGHEPLRIDIMTSITGVPFAEAWRGRTRVSIAGNQVGFLGLAELIKNKTASGRAKDRLDLALIEEAGLRPRRRRVPAAASARPGRRKTKPRSRS